MHHMFDGIILCMLVQVGSVQLLSVVTLYCSVGGGGHWISSTAEFRIACFSGQEVENGSRIDRCS